MDIFLLYELNFPQIPDLFLQDFGIFNTNFVVVTKKFKS